MLGFVVSPPHHLLSLLSPRLRILRLSVLCALPRFPHAVPACAIHRPRAMAVSSSSWELPLVAVCQVTSTPDKQQNFKACAELVREAARLGACLAFLPEAFDFIARDPAEILTYPSAFGSVTGPAHWEVLLRARAIETQCYVVAAAQCGRHHEKRASYGHSMVVDPWGTVVARCSEGPGLCLARIDLSYLRQLRQHLPVFQHRRPDLYGSLGHPLS
uniref:Nitrilase 1 n=1 Tax=Molossus molossus TaxID=27622 RepID=A0A7J8CSH6_MOLMO|nr:nitrilase 1 [Molossus molossus]